MSRGGQGSARPATLGTGLLRGRCPRTGTSWASPGFGLSSAGAGTTLSGPFPGSPPPVQGPGPSMLCCLGRVWGRLTSHPAGNGSKATALSHGEMVSLDEGSFPALELNNRRLSVKNSFCRKNGIYTR